MVRQVMSLLVVIVLSAFATANADTLIVDGLNQSKASEVQRPNRGQTMEKVETSFGQPASKQSPVGDPPITRWEYANFVVYFEYQNVIHAVQKY